MYSSVGDGRIYGFSISDLLKSLDNNEDEMERRRVKNRLKILLECLDSIDSINWLR